MLPMMYNTSKKIPLLNTICADLRMWSFKPDDNYSVCSAYRLLNTTCADSPMLVIGYLCRVHMFLVELRCLFRELCETAYLSNLIFDRKERNVPNCVHIVIKVSKTINTFFLLHTSLLLAGWKVACCKL